MEKNQPLGGKNVTVDIDFCCGHRRKSPCNLSTSRTGSSTPLAFLDPRLTGSIARAPRLEMKKAVTMVGVSAAIRAVEEEIHHAARCDAKVLITGEADPARRLSRA